MIFRKYSYNIVVRVLLIALMSLFLAWHLSSRGLDITLIVGSGIFVLQIINLITFSNKTNNTLSFFFDAVKNEDSALSFTEKSGNRSFDILNKSLNDLNRKLQEARIDITIQEKYYKAVVESATTAIMVYDEGRTIELANSAMRDLLGIPQLHNIMQLERVCPRLMELLFEIEDGEPKTINADIGKELKYLSVSSISLNLRGRKVKLVAMHDISLDLDRQEIDSWQKLIRILNHEIMNSVAPITSLSSTLSGFYKKGDEHIRPEHITEKTVANTIRGLTVIEEHGKGLISFVESYRSLTKLPRPKPEDVLLTDIFESVSVLSSSLLDSYTKKTGNSFNISSQVIPSTLTVFVDRELLTRVVFNLVKNAIEAIGEMGNAAIFLEAGKKSSGKVWIRIIDNGPGIPDELLGNIFIPFFTTKEGGSGIGLSLSRQIITMHKGSLNVYSNPGEGTTMIIQL